MFPILFFTKNIKLVIYASVAILIGLAFIYFNHYKNKQCQLKIDNLVLEINNKALQQNMEKQKKVSALYSQKIANKIEITKSIEGIKLTRQTLTSTKSIQELDNIRNCEIKNFNNPTVNCN